MYRVYGYVNGELMAIGSSFNEGKVIRIIQDNLDPEYVHFIIVKVLNDRAIPYRSILSEEEFIEYADEYSMRINDKPCNALKKEILDRRK